MFEPSNLFLRPRQNISYFTDADIKQQEMILNQLIAQRAAAKMPVLPNMSNVSTPIQKVINDAAKKAQDLTYGNIDSQIKAAQDHLLFMQDSIAKGVIIQKSSENTQQTETAADEASNKTNILIIAVVGIGILVLAKKLFF